MANELIVIEAAKEVGSAVNNVLGYVQQTKVAGKIEKIKNNEFISLVREEAHSQALGELARCNVSTIRVTAEHIDKQNLTGNNLEAANEIMNIMNQKLIDNFRRY